MDSRGGATCIIDTKARVTCWGGAAYQPDQVPATGITDAVAVTLGVGFNCVLRAGGAVLCQGMNTYGELGNGEATLPGVRYPPDAADLRSQSYGPVAGLTDAIAVSASSTHACAVRRDGSVACWGSDQWGELGTPPTSALLTKSRAADQQAISLTPLTVPPLSGAPPSDPGASPTPVLASAVSVAVGDNFSCALLADGRVSCWGDGLYGELGVPPFARGSGPAIVPGVSGAVALTAGGKHVCALTAAHRIFCWGENAFGELGRVSAGGPSAPAAVAGISDALAVVTSTTDTCALRTGGGVACWGDDSNGQIGIADTGDWVTRPQDVPRVTDATAVAVGLSGACAVRASGALVCWGGLALNSDLTQPSPDPSGAPLLVTDDPVATAQSFADWYLGEEMRNHSVDASARPEAAPALAAALAAGADGLLDPFWCARGMPDHAIALPVSSLGNTARVKIDDNFSTLGDGSVLGVNEIGLDLVRGVAGWQITLVHCGAW
jgi:Regulator of chromosome condensation (RCC1) repeat